MAVSSSIDRLRRRVESLASAECKGRAPGTPGGILASTMVTEWFEETGLEPAGEDGFHQGIPTIDGRNIIGRIAGSRSEELILVAAHYDHLGVFQGETYPGANDNASGVAVLLEVADRLLASQSDLGRDVLVVSFDAEEPPHFLENTMGSIHFVANPTVPLETIDLMVCLDVVGSPLGGPDVPEELQKMVVVSGAERAGMGHLIDRTPPSGVTFRRIGADIVPPLSDHFAFQAAGVPSLFLTCGRNRFYHTPEDTPEKLDYEMMASLADSVANIIVKASQLEDRTHYNPEASDLETSIATINDLVRAAAPRTPQGPRMLEIMKVFLEGNGSDVFSGSEAEVLRQVLETAEYVMGQKS